MFEWTWFNFFTLLVIGLSVWLLWWRYHGGNNDSSRPLAYYVLLVLYTRSFEGEYEKYAIFTAVVCALLLRFEFLGAPIVRIVKFGEAVALVYVIVRGFTLMSGGTH